MAYTGQLPKDMIITEPTIGTARVNELDDAIRQVKSAMLYGYDNTVFGSGNAAIATGVASYVRTGAGTAYITLPQISTVAGASVQRKIRIFNDTSTSGSGGSLTVSAYAGDTIATLVDLWQNESVVLIATTTDNDWKPSKLKQEHTLSTEDTANLATALGYATSASAAALAAAVASAAALDSAAWNVTAITMSSTTVGSAATALPSGILTEIFASTYSGGGGGNSNHVYIERYVNGAWRIMATASADEYVSAETFVGSAVHSDGTNVKAIHVGSASSRSNWVIYKIKI